MKLQFTKMQALGNDFILIDTRPVSRQGGSGAIRPQKIASRKISHLSKILCDRRVGIGADQLLLLKTSKIADFKMRIFNADGKEAEMCGNGIRCLAKYIWDEKLRTQNSELRTQKLAIETLAGVIYLQKAKKLIKVDMGMPVLEATKIPVRIGKKSEPIINYPVQINNRKFKITCISMGNPHTIIFVKDVRSFPVTHYGPIIENHKLFPKRTNVEFIQILNQSNIKMRVWERGVGETMACGTGASAAGVASVLLGLTHRKVTIHLLGGKLLIEWAVRDNHVYMTGPAVKVFEGIIDL